MAPLIKNHSYAYVRITLWYGIFGLAVCRGVNTYTYTEHKIVQIYKAVTSNMFRLFIVWYYYVQIVSSTYFCGSNL